VIAVLRPAPKYFTHVDVTIADEELQSLGLCWALKTFEEERIFIVPYLL
jgi:hypothetical protein